MFSDKQKLDKMPQEVWHNVLMSQAAPVALSPPPFSFDWRDVERGLPIAALGGVFSLFRHRDKDLLEVVIPARTSKHRRARKEPLSIDESDRLARVARVYELAVKVYGDRETTGRIG